jgi:diguanylate cyclase (GGDEF)-like protein
VGIDAGAALQALRGLIEINRRALEADLPGALQEVLDRLADVLDVRGVAVNLLRPAWDDFEITAIHAPPDIVAALRGRTTPRSTVERLLDPAFDVGGAFFVPAGSIADELLEGPSAVIPRDDRPDHPDHWHEDDELIVPIRGRAGELLGFMSIDEPASGLRPGPAEISLAVEVAAAATAAVRSAQEALAARRDREALHLLFEVSASIVRTDDIDEVLATCAQAIHRALGFERVAIEVADPGSQQLRVRARVGWDEGPAGASSLDEAARLSDPAYEIEGCYLWPAAAAIERVGEQARRYRSRNNGRGPQAWDHHWLMVPLTDADGTVGGWVWCDDPVDRLLPTPDRLRILRTFANQALAAVHDAVHVDRLRELARIDDLTGVLNRRAFFERLEGELARSRATDEPVTLVLYDLDQFKAINDDHGHPAGDAALRSFTRLLERNVRATDAVGRVGGDEFALVLVGSDERATRRVLDRIAATLDDGAPGLGEVRASFGTARAPDDGWQREELVAAADLRLYEHKRRDHRRRPPHIALVDDL